MATETRTTGTLTITVQDSCAADTQDSIKIELDDVLNADTCFLTNQNIYLRLFFSPLTLADDVTVDITNGDIYKNMDTSGTVKTINGDDDDDNNDILYQYFVGYGISTRTEDIVITDGEGTTGYPISDVISMDWLGDEPCNTAAVQWTVGRSTLECPSCSWSVPGTSEECKLVYGVLRIVYESKFIPYICSTPESGKLLVYAFQTEED